MKLEDLVGLCVLDGVDQYRDDFPNDYDDEGMRSANCMRFRLNGTVYRVVEDPSDGYRSNMREIGVLPHVEITNAFPPVQVMAMMKPNGDYNSHSTLILVDVQTGKIVLEAGTDRSDDYYPTFVARFDPGAMSINQRT